MNRTVCEMFAGVGGYRLGLERESSDWKTVWFSQWEPGAKTQWAHMCYVSHWGDIDEYTGIDIGLVDKSKIPNHNLLVAGFPCQDYSVARSLSGSKGIEGKKGVLWWQIRDTLEAKEASFCLFENVDRLLKSPANQRGRDFGIILACLASMDYSVEWRVVNAAEYGGAQRRRRTFIYAYRNNTKYGIDMSSREPENIIRTDGLFAKAFPIEQDIQIARKHIDYTDLAQVSSEFRCDFENSGYMSNGEIYTASITPIYETPIVLGEILQKNVLDKYYLGENLADWEYMKGAKRIQRTSKDGHEYVFSEGPIAFPDYLDRPARTMLTSEGSKNRSTHVVKDPETGRLRILTPLETERIQGFDDNWTEAITAEKMRYFVMGNALVVPMITRMARVLGPIIDAE